MQFSLKETKVKIVDVNPRAEIHGENPKPACDIKLTTILPNDVLAEFHPSLKSAFYFFDDAKRADLADQGKKAEKGFLPHLKFPPLGQPISWDDEIVGADVTVHYGTTEKSHIKMEGVLVNNFKLEMLEGGSVQVTCRVQAHPDEKQFGKLCTMIGTEIPVSIAPPEK